MGQVGKEAEIEVAVATEKFAAAEIYEQFIAEESDTV